MKTFIFSILFFFAVITAQAQATGKLYVLNEGSSSGKGTLGVIDYSTETYSHIDSLATYGNDVKVFLDKIYAVAGDGNIYVYDTTTLTIQDTIMSNARQIAFYSSTISNQILATCNTKPYFRSYDLNGNMLYSLDSSKVRSIVEGITVTSDTAFIAANAFGSDSLVIAIDLTTQDTIKTIKVAKNPQNFVLNNGTLYVSCLDYTGTTGLVISKISLDTLQNIGNLVTNITSYGSFTSLGNKIYFNNNNSFSASTIATYDLSTENIDTNALNLSVYALKAYENTLFATETDYATFGRVSYLQNDTLAGTINTHISPRSVFYVNNNTSALSEEILAEQFTAYPNPTTGKLVIQSKNSKDFDYTLFNLSGKILRKSGSGVQSSFDLSNLKSGIYILKIQVKNAIITKKIIKL